jgi:hypothetical protein
MIINFSNLGGGGGGSYTLPTATDSRLGGVKIGSGVTVTNDGTISVNEYQLSAATQNDLGGVKIGSGVNVDSAGTISVDSYTLPTASTETLGGVKIGSGVNVDSAGTISVDSYTLPTASSETLGGIKVGSGLTITSDGTLSSTGGSSSTSDVLEEITTLPADPVDGAVYNYKGKLIKYVNGAGKWGIWSTGSTLVQGESECLNYSEIPSSLDGAELCHTRHTIYNFYLFLNLTNNTIDVYNNSGKTGTTLYTITKNAGTETILKHGSTEVMAVSWSDKMIQFRLLNSGIIFNELLDTTINTAHYEIISDPIENNFPFNFTGSYIVGFTPNQDAIPSKEVVEKEVYINSTGTPATNRITFMTSSTGSSISSNWYFPVTSGDTGTLCVSQGATSAPVFKTISQALGVDFWVGSQAQYEALSPNYSPTTLYLVIPE